VPRTSEKRAFGIVHLVALGAVTGLSGFAEPAVVFVRLKKIGINCTGPLEKILATVWLINTNGLCGKYYLDFLQA
jgi:hypothetical protein